MMMAFGESRLVAVAVVPAMAVAARRGDVEVVVDDEDVHATTIRHMAVSMENVIDDGPCPPSQPSQTVVVDHLP